MATKLAEIRQRRPLGSIAEEEAVVIYNKKFSIREFENLNCIRYRCFSYRFWFFFW